MSPKQTVKDLWEQFEQRIVLEHYAEIDRHALKLTFYCGVGACLDLLLFNDEMPQEEYNQLCESLVNGVQKEMMGMHAEKMIAESEKSDANSTTPFAPPPAPADTSAPHDDEQIPGGSGS